MPKLNQEQAIDIVRRVWDQPQFQGLRASCTWRNNILERKQTIALPDLYKQTFVPQQHSLEALYAYRITMQEIARATPVYEIQSRALRKERQQAAQNFEHLMNRQRAIWCARPDSPFLLTASDQVRHGMGIYKLDLRSYAVIKDNEKRFDIWPDRPARDGQSPGAYKAAVDEYKLSKPTPFVLERVDLRTCAWFMDADGLAYVVERSERPLNEIAAVYGYGMDSDGRFYRLGEGAQEVAQYQLGKTVTFAELCSRDWIYHLVREDKEGRGGEEEYRLLQATPNPFGAVRYHLAPGVLMGEAEAGLRFRPLIEMAYEVAEYESLYDTMRAFAAAHAAFPAFDVVREEDGTPYIDPRTGQPMVIIARPFEPLEYDLPTGCRLVPRQAQAGVDLDKMQAIIEAKKQRYGPQDVLAGGSAGEREPAFGLALRGEKAEHGIRPALQGQREAWREIARQIAYCIKNWIQEEVLIWTVVDDRFGNKVSKQISVKPDDIGEDFDIDVDMHYRNTALQLANEEVLRRAKDEGDISRLRYQQKGMGVDDPLHEDAQIDLEKMQRASDAAVMWQVIEAAMVATSDELGAPRPSPEAILAMQQAVMHVNLPKRAEERRPATPLRAIGLEPPPTPIAQRPV